MPKSVCALLEEETTMTHTHTARQEGVTPSTQKYLLDLHSNERIVLPPFRYVSAANLEIEHTVSPKEKLPKEQLKFGKTFTDHMLEVDWEQGKGWGNPVIHPYRPFAMDPASAVLHYALECFEGMKAYVDGEGHVRLFRPDMNMKRLNNSMKRLLLPEFDGNELTKCLE
ncbi:hypothetical protein BBJ28_00003572 [Nothophytophthora sp. Chile5]|nr:hypothetical protein BBJ28_00003572 [Nothophytophthora sp. Chile5]